MDFGNGRFLAKAGGRRRDSGGHALEAGGPLSVPSPQRPEAGILHCQARSGCSRVVTGSLDGLVMGLNDAPNVGIAVEGATGLGVFA